jgi:hypothetical protein
MNNAGQNFYAKTALAGLVLLPWLVTLCTHVTNFDGVWLTTCAARLLDGGTLVSDCYENNPPLSIVAYFVPALLEKFAGIPKSAGLVIYGMGLTILSVLAAGVILRAQNILPAAQQGVLLLAWLIANTVLTGQWFGERDHFVLLGLLPFVLIQLGITYGWPLPRRWKWPALVIGAVAILIKPHYGVVPIFFLAHRMWKQKRVMVFGDADFLALAWMTAAYAAMLVLFFSDYVHVILPDSWRLYALPSYHFYSVWPTAIGASMVVLGAMAAIFFHLRKDNARNAPLLLLGLALLCLIPYVAQNKGFMYHFIPVKAFIFCGLALAVMNLFKSRAGLKTGILMVFFAYLSTPPNLTVPTPKAYRDYAVTQEASAGTPQCSFFLFDNIGEVQNVAHYARCELASRFSYLWFLAPLLKEKYNATHQLPHAMTVEQVDSEMRKYAAMVAADFRRYRPDTVILAQTPLETFNYSAIITEDVRRESPREMFDFPAFFTTLSPDFAALWKDYRFEKEITVLSPRHAYLLHVSEAQANARKVSYVVYKRK